MTAQPTEWITDNAAWAGASPRLTWRVSGRPMR